ncbi:MAG TPA: hypothetical protein DCP03_04890 [Polaromonas sp.]|uniref:hypothetical protein n=1 Tax=Polaromonas sp. UBA4122 TaxID=1947074 RepID=UPI000ED3B4DA|nr:hypothetical protein [Polaromonas sp. UBA4122]HAL37474.1 hypothetical protein [Polaromonas sp.]
MNVNEKIEVHTSVQPALQGPEIPIEQLVAEEYQSAPPVTKSHMLSQLIGKVFEIAPAVEKRRLIERLMRPLGLLSLVAIANGIFLGIRLRGASPGLRVGIDETQKVQTGDVIALANWIQQVSMQAVHGLAQIITTSPTLASSAAAILLVQILSKQAKTQRVDDFRK